MVCCCKERSSRGVFKVISSLAVTLKVHTSTPLRFLIELYAKNNLKLLHFKQPIAKGRFPVRNLHTVWVLDWLQSQWHGYKRVMMQLRQTVHKWTIAALVTSVLQAGDVGLQVGLSFPLSVSWTGAQLLTEILLNHPQVVWVQRTTERSATLRLCLWGGRGYRFMNVCERERDRGAVWPHIYETFSEVVCDLTLQLSELQRKQHNRLIVSVYLFRALLHYVF